MCFCNSDYFSFESPNRTIVELKLLTSVLVTRIAFSPNRTIVELKLLLISSRLLKMEILLIELS